MTVNRIAALAISAVFVVAVAVGLYLVGSPADQRQISIDNQRISDLRQISNALRYFWREQDELPDKLDYRIIRPYTIQAIPKDPETEEAYEYEVTGIDSYRLCAVFSVPSRDLPGGNIWAHDAGRQCFDFELEESDKD